MRDFMMLGGMMLLVPLAVYSRFAAYLLWGWTALLSPVYYLYGFMQPFRFNLLFAAITLALVFLKWSQRPQFRTSPAFVLMLLFLFHTAISSVIGYPDNSFNDVLGTQFFKSVIFCLVMFLIIEDRDHMHALMVMIALGLGLHGVVEGLKVISSAGGHHPSGIPTSMMSDNNHFGVAMVMVIPILYYLSQYSKAKLAKFGFLIGLFLTVITVLGTQSRGGTVALAVVGLWFFMTSTNKIKAMMVVIVASVLIYLVAPESWFERMNTITEAGGDSSFMGRVAAWKISTAIALNNPLFGGGFHALQLQAVWENFKYSEGLLGFVSTPEPDIRAKAAHSIYFEVMGDMGFLGLLLFLGIFFNAIRTRFVIQKLVKNNGTGLRWALDLANTIMLALVAYLVGGAAVSLGYFELPYMLAMLIEILRQYVLKQSSPRKIGEMS